jgi:CheY-like chemotaxis protein
MVLNALFVDDDASICEIFAMLFSSDSVRVTTFTDPVQAILYSKANPIDVIFIDYRMPELNGDEAAQQMPASIPKYLLTGDHTVDFKYEFHRIFPKPGYIEDVQALLQSMVRERNKATS